MPWTLRKSTPAGNPPVAGNTATGVLKWIALLFMFIDHSGKVIFNNNQDMRLLGRIAFPIYIWCMIVGLERTRSVPRYLLRILLVGFFSQPLYVLALDNQGHLGTLLTSLLAPLAEGMLAAPHPMVEGSTDDDYYSGKITGPDQKQKDWVAEHGRTAATKEGSDD